MLRTLAYAAALLTSAYVMSLALGGHQHLVLSLLGLIPLLRAVQVLDARRAAVCGAGWGAALALFLWNRNPAAVDSFLSLGLVPVAMAAYLGLGAWVTRRFGFSPLVLGVGWFFLEIILRPLSLHDGLLAGTQQTGTPFGVLSQVFGYAWVTFLVVYASAWLLSVVSRIRLEIISVALLPGLGCAQRGLWPLIPSLRPTHVAVPSHPRAPPHRS
jgi:apolipoprotein N-acyltransferase